MRKARMLFPKNQIGFILRGQNTEYRIPTTKKAPKVGRSYAVQSRKGVTVARVIVTEVRQENEEYIVSFKLDREHKTRLLHRDSTRGYTNNSYQSLQGEPEAVPESIQKQYSREANERWNVALEACGVTDSTAYVRRRLEKREK